MNDSCEPKVAPDSLRGNQVIALETPKAFLHNALALGGPPLRRLRKVRSS
jgi:hypothetical protein